MAAKRYYRVADWCFCVELDRTASMPDNYAPFACSETEDVLFTLHEGTIGLDNLYTEHIIDSVSDDDMPRIELYRVLRGEYEGGWLLAISLWKTSPICCRIVCSKDFKQAVLEPQVENWRFALDNALMLMYSFATSSKKTLELHASVVVKGELGYVFLGKSGTGKSTHSRQWMEAFPDVKLLNDDNPVLRILPSGEIRIYGSPWSGKTPCYVNESAVVGGIVKLEQAPKNAIRILPLAEAYAYMLSSASGLKIDASCMDDLYATISELITHIQLRQLSCLPNVEAAQCCLAGVQ